MPLPVLPLPALPTKKKYVTDYLTPEQRAKMTPEFLAILSKVEAVGGNSSAGSDANFYRNGLPAIVNPGKMIQPTTTDREMSDLGVLHESLHAYDWNDNNITGGAAWKKAIANLTPADKAELLKRGNWGKSTQPGYLQGGTQPTFIPSPKGEGSISLNQALDPKEAFAYAGMYGYENIPASLKSFYSGALVPVAGPPAPNPASGAIDRQYQERERAKEIGKAPLPINVSRGKAVIR